MNLRNKLRKHNRTHYDLPLKFDHLPRDPDFGKRLQEHFGFPPITRKLRADALVSLVTAAVIGSRFGMKTSVSLAKSFYTGKQMVYGEHFTYSHIKGALKHVEKLDVFGTHIQKRGTHNRDQSTIWASDELLTLFEKDAFISVEQAPVRLKDPSGKHMPYPKTEEARTVEARMIRINNHLQKLHVSFPADFERVGEMVKVGKNFFKEGHVELHRIFLRGNFHSHGRVYGNHTHLESEFRPRMLFNGEAVGEWDFSSLHPHMLYAKEGIQLDHDIYSVGFWPRNFWKKSFNISVNASSAFGANLALSEKLTFCYDGCSLMNKFIVGMNPDIAHHFHSDAGIGLQFQESEMILEIMETLFSKGIMNLSVHDAIIAPLSNEQRVVEVMESVYKKHNNGFSCKASRK